LSCSRTQANTEDHDAEFIEVVRPEIYSQAHAAQLGSQEIAELHAWYTEAQGKATISAGAKAAAAKGTRGKNTRVDKSKPLKGKDKDTKGKQKLSALGERTKKPAKSKARLAEDEVDEE
jgi:hypothetical protein